MSKRVIVIVTLLFIAVGIVFASLSQATPRTRAVAAAEIHANMIKHDNVPVSTVEQLQRLADDMCDLRERRVNVDMWLASKGFDNRAVFELNAVFRSDYCELK